MARYKKGGRDWFSKSYVRWRTSVYKRDDWQCQVCGLGLKTKPRRLVEAHHIRPWNQYPSLRFVVSNGITLCRRHHKQVTGKEAKYTRKFESMLKRRGHWPKRRKRSHVRSARKT